MASRIVVDTNVWFSALVYRGAPLAVLEELHLPDFQPLVSEFLLQERRSTLRRKTDWPFHQIDRAIERTAATSELVTPDLTITACRDPDDNRILECAVAGHADCIITGDQDLLTFDPFHTIRILPARDFLDSFIRKSQKP